MNEYVDVDGVGTQMNYENKAEKNQKHLTDDIDTFQRAVKCFLSFRSLSRDFYFIFHFHFIVFTFCLCFILISFFTHDSIYRIVSLHYELGRQRTLNEWNFTLIAFLCFRMILNFQFQFRIILFAHLIA